MSTSSVDAPPVDAAPVGAGAAAGRSSILSTTNLDAPGFRWVSLRKILWQVGLIGYCISITCASVHPISLAATATAVVI